MQNSDRTVRIGDRIEMKEVTICKECGFAEKKPSKTGASLERQRLSGACQSPDASIHDFVEGLKFCHILNKRGDCKFFKPLATNGYAGNSNKGEQT